VAQVVAHQVACDAAQRFLDTGDLRDDVRAVAVVFDHFLQATDLAFDAAKAVTIGRFDFGVNGHCFARASVARAISVCLTSAFTAPWHLYFSRRQYIPPTPILANPLPPGLLNDAGRQTGLCATMPRMTLVEATYELQKPLAEEQLRALGTFANTYGLRRFQINDKNHLSFEYDASRLRETEVEHVLRHLNIAVTKKVN